MTKGILNRTRGSEGKDCFIPEWPSKPSCNRRLYRPKRKYCSKWIQLATSSSWIENVLKTLQANNYTSVIRGKQKKTKARLDNFISVASSRKIFLWHQTRLGCREALKSLRKSYEGSSLRKVTRYVLISCEKDCFSTACMLDNRRLRTVNRSQWFKQLRWPVSSWELFATITLTQLSRDLPYLASKASLMSPRSISERETMMRMRVLSLVPEWEKKYFIRFNYLAQLLQVSNDT